MYWKLRSMGKSHKAAYAEVKAHLDIVTGKQKGGQKKIWHY